MNKKYLLSSVTAGIALLYANQGTAQCLTKQDCAALGYTETSCSNGGIKCPFGNTWSCTPPCGTAYKYTCSGTGYAGGSGSACGGKYTQCKCASGYEWKDGSCQKEAMNGPDGDLFYCNNEVIGVKTSSMSFYVAVNGHKTTNWSNINVDSCLTCGSYTAIVPSISQLQTVYYNRSNVNQLLQSHKAANIIIDTTYWSATKNGTSVKILDMTNGNTRSSSTGSTLYNNLFCIWTLQ